LLKRAKARSELLSKTTEKRGLDDSRINNLIDKIENTPKKEFHPSVVDMDESDDSMTTHPGTPDIRTPLLEKVPASQTKSILKNVLLKEEASASGAVKQPCVKFLNMSAEISDGDMSMTERENDDDIEESVDSPAACTDEPSEIATPNSGGMEIEDENVSGIEEEESLTAESPLANDSIHIMKKSDSNSLSCNAKKKLYRMGELYNDHPLESPIRPHSELEKTPNADIPKSVASPAARRSRLNALAKTINAWEDDLTHTNTPTSRFNFPAPNSGRKSGVGKPSLSNSLYSASKSLETSKTVRGPSFGVSRNFRGKLDNCMPETSSGHSSLNSSESYGSSNAKVTGSKRNFETVDQNGCKKSKDTNHQSFNSQVEDLNGKNVWDDSVLSALVRIERFYNFCLFYWPTEIFQNSSRIPFYFFSCSLIVVMSIDKYKVLNVNYLLKLGCLFNTAVKNFNWRLQWY